MARFKSMTTLVQRGEDGQGRDVVNVTVVHDVGQSFSRAVNPAAKRRMREYMAAHGIREAGLIDGDYGLSVGEGESMRCASVVTFQVLA